MVINTQSIQCQLNPVLDVSKELYEKIREGAKNSDHTPIKIYQYMLNH